MKSLILQRFVFRNVDKPWHFEGEGVSREPVGNEAVSGVREAQEARRIADIECSDDLLLDRQESSDEDRAKIDAKINEIKEKLDSADLERYDKEECLRAIIQLNMANKDFDSARQYAEQIQNAPFSPYRKQFVLAEIELAVKNYEQVRAIVSEIEHANGNSGNTDYCYAKNLKIYSYIDEKNYDRALAECEMMEGAIMAKIRERIGKTGDAPKHPEFQYYDLSHTYSVLSDIYKLKGNSTLAAKYRKMQETAYGDARVLEFSLDAGDIKTEYGEDELSKNRNESNLSRGERLITDIIESDLIKNYPELEFDLWRLYINLGGIAKQLGMTEKAAAYREEEDMLRARLSKEK